MLVALARTTEPHLPEDLPEEALVEIDDEWGAIIDKFTLPKPDLAAIHAAEPRSRDGGGSVVARPAGRVAGSRTRRADVHSHLEVPMRQTAMRSRRLLLTLAAGALASAALGGALACGGDTTAPGTSGLALALPSRYVLTAIDGQALPFPLELRGERRTIVADTLWLSIEAGAASSSAYRYAQRHRYDHILGSTMVLDVALERGPFSFRAGSNVVVIGAPGRVLTGEGTPRQVGGPLGIEFRTDEAAAYGGRTYTYRAF